MFIDFLFEVFREHAESEAVICHVSLWLSYP